VCVCVCVCIVGGGGRGSQLFPHPVIFEPKPRWHYQNERPDE
jgi:hypothetical protein